MVDVSHRNQTSDNVVGVQAGIPLPIFNRNQGNIMQADAELVAAENDARRIQLELQNRLAIAFRRYENARQQVARYQNEIIPRAKQSIDLVTQGYGAGQLGFQPLLTSQRTYVRANLMYLDALSELRQASTLIEGQAPFRQLAKRNIGKRAGNVNRHLLSGTHGSKPVGNLGRMRTQRPISLWCIPAST